jgi:hypothetical protein
MKVEKSLVAKYCIREENHDAINVIVEDFKKGQGRIWIECFGDSWSYYWADMGNNNLMEFFADCGEHYIANKLSTISSSVVDEDGIEDHIKREILKNRRNWDINKEEARGFYDRAICIEHGGYENLMSDVFGYEWYEHFPMKSNHEYDYLCNIIKLVQRVFKDEILGDMVDSEIQGIHAYEVGNRVRILRKDAGKDGEGKPLSGRFGRINGIDGYYVYVRVDGFEDIELELYASEIELIDD